jgi:hypothetical protein
MRNLNVKYAKSRLFLIIVLLAFVTVTGFISARRAEKGSNDFDTFYAAGQSVYSYGNNLYYTGPYHERTSEVSPFLYSPFAAIFFSLFSWANIRTSAFFWNFFNICLFLAVLNYFSRILKFEWKSVLQINGKGQKAFVFIYIIFSGALFLDNLTMAQMNISVFFFCLVGVHLFMRKKLWLAGFMLAFAILLKMTPALFIFYFLVKRQWKVLTSIFLGLIVFTAIIPTFIFGPQKNLILHRQWLGRTVKPLYITVTAKWVKEPDHPKKKSAKIIAHDQLTSQLTQKNQALSASLTRWLLKNRNEKAGDPELPIYAALKYKNLPVLFGGLSHEKLGILIRILQMGLLGVLIYLWLPRKRPNDDDQTYLELSLLFLSLTLLAPWARSHQAISWIFFLTWGLSKVNRTEGDHKRDLSIISIAIFGALLCYFAQALPYGKAIGFGTVSNLILWVTAALLLFKKISFKEESKRFNESMSENLDIER